jgi:hypothetical protein
MILQFTRIINSTMKQHLALMESRVKMKLSCGLGSIETGHSNKEKQIVLGGKGLPKTSLHIGGWTKRKSATLPHRKSDTANKPIKHLAVGFRSLFQA